MLAKGISSCLDSDRGRAFKETQFINVGNAGDPIMRGSREDLERSASRFMGW